jgi:predicted nucleotidyltransferase component of viral defense system
MKKERASVEKLKKLAIIALASDDELMETLILKGGNAIQLGYNLSYRASFDLDFSMSADFEDLEEISSRMERLLAEVFYAEALHVFDFTFGPRPENSNESTKDFWGGYLAQFKVIETERLEQISPNNLPELRKWAIPVFPNHSPVVNIEISKFEYVEDRQDFEIEGLTIYVYAPRLLVFEKVRAICQQIPEYSKIVPSFSPRPRTRDFYDIYILLEHFDIELNEEESKEVMKKVFDAKRVPHHFLKRMSAHKEIHKQDFPSLLDTVSPLERGNLKDFDFYFDYVVERFENFLA